MCWYVSLVTYYIYHSHISRGKVRITWKFTRKLYFPKISSSHSFFLACLISFTLNNVSNITELLNEWSFTIIVNIRFIIIFVKFPFTFSTEALNNADWCNTLFLYGEWRVKAPIFKTPSICNCFRLWFIFFVFLIHHFSLKRNKEIT